MDMKMIGSYLKELRINKGLTQEQAGDIFGVAGRTVSRWETGSNMPDIGLLLEIAGFYGVSVDSILSGGRAAAGHENTPDPRRENSEKTALLAADYTASESLASLGRFRLLLAAGLTVCIMQMVIKSVISSGVDGGFVSVFDGFIMGLFIAGLIISGRYGNKIRQVKKSIFNKLAGKGKGEAK